MSEYIHSYVDGKGHTVICSLIRIVCAANRYGDHIIASARHHDALMRKIINSMGGRSKLLDGCEREEQGFIDQYGDWWNREEAMNIVVQNGQKLRTDNTLPIGVGLKLFSEHLY
jgi:hypothetical protein